MCFAQKENPPGAASNGMAGAVCAMPDASHALQAVACYAFAETPGASFNIRNHFLLPELFTSSLQVVFPMKNKLRIAGSAQRFGPEHYKEIRWSVALAHRVGHTAMGLRLHWEELTVEGFPTQHAFTAEIGGQTQLTEHLRFGGNLYNFTLSGFTNQPLPVILKCGLSMDCTPYFTAALELEKQSTSTLQVKWGLCYEASPHVFLLAGFRHPDSSLHGGLLMKHDLLSVSYSIKWQFRLGLNQELSIRYRLPSKTKS